MTYRQILIKKVREKSQTCKDKRIYSLFIYLDSWNKQLLLHIHYNNKYTYLINN